MRFSFSFLDSRLFVVRESVCVLMEWSWLVIDAARIRPEQQNSGEHVSDGAEGGGGTSRF